jgi:hypothetical protein
VPVDTPYTMIVDATHIPRSSLKMPGTSWLPGLQTAKWQRGFQRCQRFENISWLTPIEGGYSRVIPLRWEHIPSEKAVKSNDSPRKAREAARDGIKWARKQLDGFGRAATAPSYFCRWQLQRQQALVEPFP